MNLSEKVFVVGGASRGIGRAIAGELVAAGARVVLLSRSTEAVEAAAAQLGELATPVAADGGAPDTPERVRAALAGHVDGVVVNSGGPPLGRALELSDDDWRGSYELLIGGPAGLLRGPLALVDNG